MLDKERVAATEKAPFMKPELLQSEMTSLIKDVSHLYAVKYPKLANGLQAMDDEQLMTYFVELCDIFDLYREVAHTVSAAYQEERIKKGSLELRDWPEN